MASAVRRTTHRRKVNNARVPLIAEHHAQTFRALHGIKADVFVAQHGSVFALEDKARRAEALSTGSAQGAANPFVDPEGDQRFVDRSEHICLKQLALDQRR